MNSINSVVLNGTMVGDPQINWISDEGDKAIANLRLAVDYSKKQGDEWVEEAAFIDVSVFGGVGALVGRKLKKGDSVQVQGSLRQDNWERDGEKRSKLVVHAQTVNSEGFFRAKEENRELALTDRTASAPAPAPAATTESTPAASTAADDDIPF